MYIVHVYVCVYNSFLYLFLCYFFLFLSSAHYYSWHTSTFLLRSHFPPLPLGEETDHVTSHDPSHSESHEVHSNFHNRQKATPTDNEEPTDNNSMSISNTYMYRNHGLPISLGHCSAATHTQHWWGPSSPKQLHVHCLLDLLCAHLFP